MTPNRRTFLKQMGYGTAGVSLFSLVPAGQTKSITVIEQHLPRAKPEAEGVSSAGIFNFLEAIAKSKHELHSLMLVRHGRVVAEGWWSPYAPQLNHTMYSMSKSFTSTAVGFAVAEGRLAVTDRVVSFFPKELPAQVSENQAALRVQDLLTMSVGNEREPTGAVVKEENWVKTFLAQPITHQPGSVFMYNSAATYMCSAIVQRLTGQPILDYLKPRLFFPLGIDSATWETCPRGINTGGWGLGIKTEGLAKFGQLYLQKGRWNGRQILPAKWVEEATTFKIQQPLPASPGRPNAQNDWLQGYGYQFWRSQHNAYRGDGAFGQFTVVLPEQDAVLALTAESSDMQGVLDLVWTHLLPAMKTGAQPADSQAQVRLQHALSSLALDLPKGKTISPAAARISEKLFRLESNALGLESAMFMFTKDYCQLTLRDAQNIFPIQGGLETWRRGATGLPNTPPRIISGGGPKAGTLHPVAVSGTWKDEATFELLLRYIETPHHDSVTCLFEGDQLKISFRSSLGKMNGAKDSRPVLVGRLLG